MTEREMTQKIAALEKKIREIPGMMTCEAEEIPTEIQNEWQTLEKELGHAMVFELFLGELVPDFSTDMDRWQDD